MEKQAPLENFKMLALVKIHINGTNLNSSLEHLPPTCPYHMTSCYAGSRQNVLQDFIFI